MGCNNSSSNTVGSKALAFAPQNGFEYKTNKLDVIARVLLMGVYDDDNILSKLRGTRYILKQIWEYAISFNNQYWPKYIKRGNSNDIYMDKIQLEHLSWPKATNIHINMMPFKMCRTFKDSKLPSYVHSYWPFIQLCLNEDYSQMDKICFLTVHESFVKAGRTQRRPGLHVETPGNVIIGGGNGKEEFTCRTFWDGGGQYVKEYRDGIYMASNVQGTCVMYDCKVDDDGVIGHLGDIEHLRRALRLYSSDTMQFGYMHWITDRTPHEVFPVKEDCYRQFFRLVTHNVSVWYKEHSTENPNGVVPDPSVTHIIETSKF